MATSLRRPPTLVVLAATVVLAVVATLATLALLRTRGGDPEPAGLGSRTVKAGAVEVRMTALSLDASGARFRLVLDTHSVDLGLDLASAARLRVNGSLTAAGTWEGTKPGGQHREGTLRFTSAVPAGAAVELRITGLPTDATATWTAP